MRPPESIEVTNCMNKTRYPDEYTARAGAQYVISVESQVDKLYIYHCHECNGWHLTKQPRENKWLVTEDNLVSDQPDFPDYTASTR